MLFENHCNQHECLSGRCQFFDRSRFGLKSVHVRNVAGLIFVCFDANPPVDFDEVAEFIEPYLTPYGLPQAKVAHQIDLTEEGNWKLVMENNRECQHCDGAHPELVTAYFPLFGYSEDDIYYGGIGYGSDPTQPDLSNTQFALESLRAAGVRKGAVVEIGDEELEWV